MAPPPPGESPVAVEPDRPAPDEQELPAALQPAWSPTEIIDVPFSDRPVSEPANLEPPDAPPPSTTAEPPAPTPPKPPKPSLPEHSAPEPAAPDPLPRPIAPQTPSTPRPRSPAQPPRWPTAPQPSQQSGTGGQKGPIPYPAAKSPPQLMVVVGISVILGSCLLGLASAAIDLPTLLDALVWCGSIGGIICLAVGIVGLANQRSGRPR